MPRNNLQDNVRSSSRPAILLPKSLRIVVPLLRPLAGALNFLWWIVFGWWLDPIEQERKNDLLRRDLKTSLYFLFPEGKFVVENNPAILPFDYASARISFGNFVLGFTRGRGELNIIVAPQYLPDEARDLSLVLSALESRRIFIPDLAAASSALASQVGNLNSAFAEQQYPRLREKL